MGRSVTWSVDLCANLARSWAMESEDPIFSVDQTSDHSVCFIEDLV